MRIFLGVVGIWLGLSILGMAILWIIYILEQKDDDER